MGWEPFLAWLVAACCSLLAVRLMRRLQRWAAPEPAALLSELLAEIGASGQDSEFVQRAAIAELNRRLSDVSFELGSLPARLTALTRICLASGTALALIGYIDAHATARAPIERVLGLVACAAGGLLGAAFVLSVGRVAKGRSGAIREGWDRSSREVGKGLGTSLESAGTRRRGAS
ncbi:MAG: hypothetical protein WDO74_19810 [Pseudomonadota bacterium]